MLLVRVVRSCRHDHFARRKSQAPKVDGVQAALAVAVAYARGLEAGALLREHFGSGGFGGGASADSGGLGVLKGLVLAPDGLEGVGGHGDRAVEDVAVGVFFGWGWGVGFVLEGGG